MADIIPEEILNWIYEEAFGAVPGGTTEKSLEELLDKSVECFLEKFLEKFQK